MRWFFVTFVLVIPACQSIEPGVLPGLPQTGRPVVFVADGAGDFRACSESFRQTAEEDRLPLEVVTFVWSHGYLRNFADQTDREHIQRRGEMLAATVQQSRQQFPNAPISLVGHSAGCGVILAAAEHLPPGAIDRIVLLSPSMSEDYDLRPALTSARDGIDAFISSDDWIWLGAFVGFLGTPDNPTSIRASGRYGFHPRANDPLYSKLHVHSWTPEQVQVGHDGGHFGCYQPAFIRQNVLPLLMTSRTAAISPAR